MPFAGPHQGRELDHVQSVVTAAIELDGLGINEEVRFRLSLILADDAA
jgi:hypothetical protein